MIELARKARRMAALLRLKDFSAKFANCPICGPTLLVKLADAVFCVRCVRCGSSIIHMSIVRVVQRLYPDLSGLTVYEMSSRGPLFNYLHRHASKLVCSEYFDGVAPGEFSNGIQCQDVQQLTYSDEFFDLCTSTEVFEHVPDDMKGFKEVWRVLRRGGRFIFTVPFADGMETVERVAIVNGEVRHLKLPEYHGDVIRGNLGVLCFRNYGRDIVERLLTSGFSAARLVSVDECRWWGLEQQVIVAEK